MNVFKKIPALLLIFTAAAILISSCKSTVPEVSEEDSEYFIPKEPVSRLIAADGTRDADTLYRFFISHCKKNKLKAKAIAKLYIEECRTEGINSDVAFIQMCHETNFLQYGNLVKKQWNNFCGLGAINAENPGLKFKTMRDGVRAHVQHLHAYGTTADVTLINAVIDPRYKYVNPRGKAPDIYGLTGTWAADRGYSDKLDKFLAELEKF